MPGKPDIALASMGIYVFTTEFLFDQLRRDAADPESKRDFGGDIIPYIVKHGEAGGWSGFSTNSVMRPRRRWPSRKPCRLRDRYFQAPDSHVRTLADMLLEHQLIVHLRQM